MKPTAPALPKWTDEELEIWDKVMSYPVGSWEHDHFGESLSEGDLSRSRITYQILTPTGARLTVTKNHTTWSGSKSTYDLGYRIIVDGNTLGHQGGEGFVETLFDEILRRHEQWKLTDPEYLRVQGDKLRQHREQTAQSQRKATQRKRDELDKL